MQTKMNCLLWTIMVPNVVCPLVYTSITMTYNMKYCNKGIDTMLPGSIGFKIWMVSRYTVGLFQLVSGICLIVAIVKIRRYLVKNTRLEKLINY